VGAMTSLLDPEQIAFDAVPVAHMSRQRSVIT
jgi:hypothetical protein